MFFLLFFLQVNKQNITIYRRHWNLVSVEAQVKQSRAPQLSRWSVGFFFSLFFSLLPLYFLYFCTNSSIGIARSLGVKAWKRFWNFVCTYCVQFAFIYLFLAYLLWFWQTAVSPLGKLDHVGESRFCWGHWGFVDSCILFNQINHLEIRGQCDREQGQLVS